jgi:hypothetical protein
MRLPAPRGPITATLFEELATRPHDLPARLTSPFTDDGSDEQGGARGDPGR